MKTILHSKRGIITLTDLMIGLVVSSFVVVGSMKVMEQVSQEQNRAKVNNDETALNHLINHYLSNQNACTQTLFSANPQGLDQEITLAGIRDSRGNIIIPVIPQGTVQKTYKVGFKSLTRLPLSASTISGSLLLKVVYTKKTNDKTTLDITQQIPVAVTPDKMGNYSCADMGQNTATDIVTNSQQFQDLLTNTNNSNNIITQYSQLVCEKFWGANAKISTDNEIKAHYNTCLNLAANSETASTSVMADFQDYMQNSYKRKLCFKLGGSFDPGTFQCVLSAQVTKGGCKKQLCNGTEYCPDTHACYKSQVILTLKKYACAINQNLQVTYSFSYLRLLNANLWNTETLFQTDPTVDDVNDECLVPKTSNCPNSWVFKEYEYRDNCYPMTIMYCDTFWCGTSSNPACTNSKNTAINPSKRYDGSSSYASSSVDPYEGVSTGGLGSSTKQFLHLHDKDFDSNMPAHYVGYSYSIYDCIYGDASCPGFGEMFLRYGSDVGHRLLSMGCNLQQRAPGITQICPYSYQVYSECTGGSLVKSGNSSCTANASAKVCR